MSLPIYEIHIYAYIHLILEAQVLAQQISSFHSVMFNPVNSKYLVTAHSEEGIALWDARKPKT